VLQPVALNLVDVRSALAHRFSVFVPTGMVRGSPTSVPDHHRSHSVGGSRPANDRPPRTTTRALGRFGFRPATKSAGIPSLLRWSSRAKLPRVA